MNNTMKIGDGIDHDEEQGNAVGDELATEDFLTAAATAGDASSVVGVDDADGNLTFDLESGTTSRRNVDDDVEDAKGHRRDKTTGTPSLFARIFSTRSNVNSPANSERSNAGGKWKSMGSRRIRFATHASDIDDDGRRGIVATPIGASVGTAMGRRERMMKNIQGVAEDVGEGGQQIFGVDAKDSLLESNVNQMYRLQATRTHDVSCIRKTFTFLYSIVNCGALHDASTEQSLSFMGLPNPNRWLIDFFYWLFRKGWSTVITVALVMFYALVLFFTLLIYWAASIDSDCVRVGGAEFGSLPTRSRFFDAFSLSWNTFSTVGYGSTYPALSTEHNHDGDHLCAFAAFITSIEALVGVIFGGFVGAIIFAKVTRISQRAPVKFSDPLLVKFGSGVDSYSGLDSDEHNLSNDEDKKKAEQAGKGNDNSETASNDKARFKKLVEKAVKPSPFPVLEFRIANKLHSRGSGEIIGANVNAVVITESTMSDDQVSDDLANQIIQNRLKRTIKETTGVKIRRTVVAKTMNMTPASIDGSSRSIESSSTADETTSSGNTMKTKNTVAGNAMNYLHLNALANNIPSFGLQKMKIDEECSGSHIVPRMVFSKLVLNNSEHPFFKRCWNFRHTIDANSPLLTTKARQVLLENNGNWPWEWNNQEAIRKTIHFNQIVVSFTGVSNISAAPVYKQKVYDYIDCVIGYQFVNPLYRGRGGKLKVDLEIINDVIEQNGGGAEPLNMQN